MIDELQYIFGCKKNKKINKKVRNYTFETIINFQWSLASCHNKQSNYEHNFKKNH